MGKKTLFFVASALALSACSSGPRPVAELTRAHTLVDTAQQAGAQQYAGADLEAARNKLQEADKNDTDREVAVRLAEEASVDAEVATARTRAAKAELALAQVDAGSESLRRETSQPPQTP